MKRIAAIFGGLAVILGALGAHALKDLLDSAAMESFKTATMYQLFHAIALLALPNESRNSFGPLDVGALVFYSFQAAFTS